MVGRQMGADLSQKATMPFLVIMVANGVNTLYFNFAAVETSIIVILTALTTLPVLAALLSFVILREATTRRTWQAIVMTMAGVLIVVFNGEGTLAAPEGSVFLGGFLGVMTALCIAVVFVFTRRYPQTPVLLAVSLGTLSTGFMGFLGTDLQEMITMGGALMGVAGDAAGMVPAVAGSALYRANQCQPVDAARNGAGAILGLAWHRRAAKPDDAGGCGHRSGDAGQLHHRNSARRGQAQGSDGKLTPGAPSCQGLYFRMIAAKRGELRKSASQRWRCGQGCASNQSGSAMRNWRTKGRLAKSRRPGCAPDSAGWPVSSCSKPARVAAPLRRCASASSGSKRLAYL